MAQATLIIKTDAKVKKETARLADAFGLSVNAIVNGFLRHFIEERSITFSASDCMTPALERSLKKSLRAEKAEGKSVFRRVETPEELKAYLDSIV